MKRIGLLSMFGIGVISICTLTGCRSTLRYVEVERVDQGLTAGNRGYIYGSPPSQEVTVPSKRTILEMEVELPPIPEYEGYRVKKPKMSPSETTTVGNRGYLIGGKYEPAFSGESEPTVISAEEERIPEVTDYIVYTVKKGDSLSRIAKQIYGNSNKWRKIYEANTDKIKDPNRLKIGLILKIPQE